MALFGAVDPRGGLQYLLVGDLSRGPQVSAPEKVLEAKREAQVLLAVVENVSIVDRRRQVGVPPRSCTVPVIAAM